MNSIDNLERTIVLSLKEWKRVLGAFERLPPRRSKSQEALRRGIVDALSEYIRTVDDSIAAGFDRPERSWLKLVNAAARWGIDYRLFLAQFQEPPQQRLPVQLDPDLVRELRECLERDEDYCDRLMRKTSDPQRRLFSD